MKSNYWIIFIVFLIGILAIFSYFTINSNYIEESNINYTFKNDKINKALIVEQSDTYVIKHKIDKLNISYLVPIKDFLFDKSTLTLVKNMPYDLIVEIYQGNKLLESYYNLDILGDGIEHKKSVINTQLTKGIYTIKTYYKLPIPIISYNDFAQFVSELKPINSNYKINSLNVNISLPKDYSCNYYYLYKNNNVEKLEFHGSNLKLNFFDVSKNNNIKIRMLFDNSSIKNPIAKENISIMPLIDNNIKEYNTRNTIMLYLDLASIFGFLILTMYFVYLVLVYDYQNVDNIVGKSYEQVLDEIPPVVGACIVQERNCEKKDILALLIHLVNIKVLDMKKTKKIDGNTKFEFYQNKEFFKNKEKLKELTKTELETLNLFLLNNKFEYDNNFELESKLLEIHNDYRLNLKLETIINDINDQIEQIGGNSISVPNYLKIINKIIMFLSIIFVIFRIVFGITTLKLINTKSILYNIDTFGNIIELLKPFAKILIIAGLAYLIYEIITLLIIIALEFAKFIYSKYIQKIKKDFLDYSLLEKKFFNSSIRNVFRLSQKYLISISLITAVIYYLFPSAISIASMLIFMIASLIVITDNYMKKHSIELIDEYIGLKILEDKILNGSYLAEKDFQSYLVYGKYLTFALALGIGDHKKYDGILNQEIKEKLEFDAFKEVIFNPNLYNDLLKNFNKRQSDYYYYNYNTLYKRIFNLFIPTYTPFSKKTENNIFNLNRENLNTKMYENSYKSSNIYKIFKIHK